MSKFHDIIERSPLPLTSKELLKQRTETLLVLDTGDILLLVSEHNLVPLVERVVERHKQWLIDELQPLTEVEIKSIIVLSAIANKLNQLLGE